jgi:peptide deformylase
MMNDFLEILTYPNRLLAKSTEPVRNIDGKFQKIIERMAVTMYKAPGIGLAAIQVGIDQSFFIYDLASQDQTPNLQVLVNPVIISKEDEILSENEGCLSVPDYRADVKRAANILVEGFDRNGKPIRLEAQGYQAIVIQHEIDHLSGTLFIDHISALKRGLYKRRIKKKIKQ